MPLEWSYPAKPDKTCPYDYVRAKTPFVTYLVTWKSWKDDPVYTVETVEYSGFFAPADSLDEAKKTAQDDFDKQIAASLKFASRPDA